MAFNAQNRAVLPPGYRFRPCTLEDASGVVDLMNACTLAVMGIEDESVEETLTQWQSPGHDLESSQRIIESADGRIVGFSQVMDHSKPVAPIIDIYVHPDCESVGIGEVLADWTEARARESIKRCPPEARVVMHGYMYGTDHYYRKLLESIGMHCIRHSFHMQIDFDGAPPLPNCPEGISIRSFQPGDDARDVLRVQRDSFQDHFGYFDTPFEAHFERWRHEWMGSGEFESALWFLAFEGDTLAGIALCKLSRPEDADMGWVQTLGVMRDYRKRGIGMALLLHAFHVLYGLGKKRAGLGVDASSLTGAVRLYESAGMRAVKQFDLFEKELRPGVSLLTEETPKHSGVGEEPG